MLISPNELVVRMSDIPATPTAIELLDQWTDTTDPEFPIWYLPQLQQLTTDAHQKSHSILQRYSREQLADLAEWAYQTDISGRAGRSQLIGILIGYYYRDPRTDDPRFAPLRHISHLNRRGRVESHIRWSIPGGYERINTL